MSDKKISQLTASTTPLAGTEVLPVVQSGVTKQVSVNNLTAGKAVNGLTFTANGRATIRTASIADAPSPTGNGVGIGFSGGPSIAPTDGNGAIANGSVDLGRSDAKWKDFYLAGNVVIGTAGKGIDFSADGQAAGMTSELLDDYEEGTWTPVIQGSGTAGTYELDANTKCEYTKIGRLITLVVRIRLAPTVTGGGVGDLYILGAPFTKSLNQIAMGSVYLALGTFTGNLPAVSFNSLEGTSTTLYFPQSVSGGYGTSLPISFASANAYIGFTISYFV
jgi:hypothetical protein